MYGLIWDLLPGPFLVKLVLALALATGVFFGLMEYVFPWLSAMMPYNDIAV